ncbi:hypothetical protein BYT27DRAFT_7326430 [Phlegmacium glaucopus]|nr:hypothetical protein BYT27DRAFT_7326430 [Phlegmacium glaucopus]
MADDEVGRFVQEYDGAAKGYGTGITFMQQFDRDTFTEERAENLYYPFASREEWELAAFLLRSDLSMAALDKFLSLTLIKGLNLSFRTGKRLRGLAEMLPKGPEWQCKPWETLYPTKKPLYLYYRDPLECIQSILYHPLVKDFIKFSPFRLYESAAKAMRIYTEWLSGDVAWSMQRQLPDGATLLGIILSSDKTNLSSMTGGRVAHPLLISLANLLMDFRTKATNHAFHLLALLPIPKFTHKNRTMRGVLENRLIHECLDFILHPPRTAFKTLRQLTAIEEEVDPWDLDTYLRQAKAHRLNGVHRPFWRDWPLSDPSKFFTPEPLHHWHKMFWDHDAQWCIRVVGDAEIDFRFSILHPHTGFRQFPEGISKLKQVTGREHRDIQRYIVAVIADSVPKDFLIAIRALADFRYLAQSPEVSDNLCTEIDHVLREFHDHKDTIIAAGGRLGKGRVVIDNWYIPKLEFMQSVTSSVCDNGAPIQWSADHTERCNITEIKVPSRAGNNQGYEPQICRYLDRDEKCRQFDLATAICEAKIDFHSLFCSSDADDDNGNVEYSGLFEDPEEPNNESLSTINSTSDLFTHIQPVTRLSGAVRHHANYFELANALELNTYPRSPLPHRTIIRGRTALHLSRDPTMKLTVDDAMNRFNLPDLRGAFADFLQHGGGGDLPLIGGRRIADANAELPFDYLQIWTKLQLQNHAYHPPYDILPPQTVNAAPSQGSWTFGHSDIVLVNTDPSQVWPSSGLEGHHVVQLRLIFRAVPHKRSPSHPCTDMLLAYVQHFDFIPQSNPQRPSQKGLYVEPSTGMYHLKRARRSDGSIFGGVIPFGRIRTLIDLVPRFGEFAEKHLAKETALEYSLEFRLNKYFEKELFYALK